MSLCAHKKRKEEWNLPTNVNFLPVMSKTITMTDILLLINVRRTTGGREQKKKMSKQKLIDHMHLSWVTALEQKKTFNRAQEVIWGKKKKKKERKGFGCGMRLWGSKPLTGHFKVQNHYRALQHTEQTSSSRSLE